MSKEIILGHRYFIKTEHDKEPKEKELRSYTCGYCDTKFKQWVGTGYSMDGKRSVSDQVRCPNCKNNLKTW